MKEVLVSVLIPCYNAASFIKDAINSITNQTYKKLEIICINDSSKDETGNILEDLAKKDSRIKVYHNDENLGLIRTLNKGINLANGGYVARMDADDISLLTRIEEEMNLILSDETIDAVSIYTDRITSKGKTIGKFNHFCCTESNSCRFMALFDAPILHAGLLIKTKILKEYMFCTLPSSMHIEDYELWNRMLADGRKFKIIPKILYRYRVNFESVSYKESDLQKKNHTQCSKFFLKKELGIELEESVHRIVISRFYPSDVNYRNVKQALLKFNIIKNSYLSKNEPIDKKSKQEIISFVEQRTLFILTKTIAVASVSDKIKLLRLVLKNIHLFFNLKTWENIKLRFLWLALTRYYT